MCGSRGTSDAELDDQEFASALLSDKHDTQRLVVGAVKVPRESLFRKSRDVS